MKLLWRQVQCTWWVKLFVSVPLMQLIKSPSLTFSAALLPQLTRLIWEKISLKHISIINENNPPSDLDVCLILQSSWSPREVLPPDSHFSHSSWLSWTIDKNDGDIVKKKYHCCPLLSVTITPQYRLMMINTTPNKKKNILRKTSKCFFTFINTWWHQLWLWFYTNGNKSLYIEKYFGSGVLLTTVLACG